MKVFQWVATLKRPLALHELQEALVVEPCQETWNPEQMVNDKSQIIPWCGNLISFEEEEETVQFAHHSIKQFFLFSVQKPELSSFRLEGPDTERYIGTICVTYLSFTDFDFERRLEKHTAVPTRRMIEPQQIASTLSASSSRFTQFIYMLQAPRYRESQFDYIEKASDLIRSSADNTTTVERLRTDYHFLNYASEYWLLHTGDFSKDDKDIWNKWKTIVKAENPLAQTPWSASDWAEALWFVQYWIVDNDHCALLQLWVKEKHTFLQIAIMNLVGTRVSSKILTWVAKRTDIPQCFEFLQCALESAARQNNFNNVKILWPLILRFSGGYKTAAVRFAAQGGYVKMLKYLVDQGTSVTCPDGLGNEPLHWAALNGREAVVKILLLKGANPMCCNNDQKKPS